MTRPTAKQARLRFDQRYEACLEERIADPEAQDALSRIKHGAYQNFENGIPNEVPPPIEAGRHFPGPFVSEESILGGRGVRVRIIDHEDGPEVVLTLSLEAEGEGRAARLLYPQDLLRPAEYDLWEIRREGALSQILEDVQVTWEELRRERDLAAQGKLPLPGVELPERKPRRGRSIGRRVMALEAYRSYCQGETWVEIGQRIGCHESTVRAAARQLAREIGLPWPAEWASELPDPPDVDCETCPKRVSGSALCADCPFPDFLALLESRGQLPPSEP